MYNCQPFVLKNFGIGVYKKHPSECTETEFTHTSVVVGYGTNEQGDDYWEIINSYGEGWGHDGYFKLARNTEWDQSGGQNGILHKPAYVVPKISKDLIKTNE